MPTVTRSRSLPVEPERIWALVADPHNLPRWWPETVRVEDVHGKPGAQPQPLHPGLRDEQGQAGPRRLPDAPRRPPRERLVWEQQIEGTPFEGFLRDAELEMRDRRRRRDGSRR